jgi:hypothetical protein
MTAHLTGLVTVQNIPAGVAVNSSNIYWTNHRDGTIHAAPLTDPISTATLVTGQNEPTGVTVSP